MSRLSNRWSLSGLVLFAALLTPALALDDAPARGYRIERGELAMADGVRLAATYSRPEAGLRAASA